MVVRKSKKVNKYRAHTTHGGGHRKKRRGAGSRGGRGNAGLGKRAGHKKRQPLAGRQGFRPRRTIEMIKSINVSFFTAVKVENLVAEGKAIKEGNIYVIDLAKLGVQKLLGTGKTNVALKLTVATASVAAIEKVESAGGHVLIANQVGDTETQSS
ncbi:50S ribosomal protein L15 [Candidatus Woesearchaeota archaeon CG10_big_fil_rev_8_21_14_0_10_32_24]|nr:MAG: 50S ribosomal protein L15 [Candidatus Woesearchaeota archaeon CG10_big_fil_rev_8_21_14_0_10_32_24]